VLPIVNHQQQQQQQQLRCGLFQSSGVAECADTVLCRAVPCRAVPCHCLGEINTLQGNLNWVASRQAELEHPIWAGREEQLLPLCNAAGTHSCSQVVELCTWGGLHSWSAAKHLVGAAAAGVRCTK
jgi:glutamate synthase domain-containing protein 1